MFAIKIIEKEECKKLAKRQHPNVYNEVEMERRILTQHRFPRHVNIVRAYHAMQGELSVGGASRFRALPLELRLNSTPQIMAICIS